MTRLGQYVRLARAWRRLKPFRGEPGSVFLHQLADLDRNAVLREDALVELARGRRVLHFGFTDAPFTAEKMRGGRLLHTRLEKVAAVLHGADINAEAIDAYTQATGDHRVHRLDIEVELPEDHDLVRDFDLVLFGETLEHLRNPGAALQRLRQLCVANAPCRLCVTVPNALALLGFMVAVDGNELVHPEHYAYYSPVTLRNLLAASGFGDIRIGLYANSAVSQAAPGIAHDGLIAVCAPA